MEISMISFTEQGERLAGRIRESLPDWTVSACRKPGQGLASWTGEQFAKRNALVFIGACGIAVRAAAPFVKDKLLDSPVLVIDEKGQYVIPILSGHVGGANELAEILAKRIGALAVITTASDIRHKFAADVFARKNHLTILNKDGIVKVASRILAGETITMSIEGYDNCGERIPEEIRLMPYPPGQETDVVVSTDARYLEHAVLKLKPKAYAIGIGCKKGKPKEELERFIRRNLENLKILEADIFAASSIACKKEETGICAWAKEAGIPFLTFSEKELNAVQGCFHSSAFVKQVVGVDNVCERAALAACGEGGMLVLGKQAENGMTLAVARKKREDRYLWGV